MAQVPQITVKDAIGANVDVATLTAIAALIGEVQASPTANTLLDRQKTLATLSTALNALIGEVQTTPTTNTLLARTKAIQDKLVSGTLLTSPVSGAHDVRLDWNRPADTTAYLAGDVVGGAKQFAAVGANGGGVLITGLQLAINVPSFTSGTPTSFRQHFYSVTPPSALADNAPWDLPVGDRASYLGYIDIPTIADLGATWYIEASNINKQIRLASTDVWSYLVTNAAYTPSSAEGYSQTIHTVEV